MKYQKLIDVEDDLDYAFSEGFAAALMLVSEYAQSCVFDRSYLVSLSAIDDECRTYIREQARINTIEMLAQTHEFEKEISQAPLPNFLKFGGPATLPKNEGY